MKTKVPFRKRLRYAIDSEFSKGSGALILWLGILSLSIMVISALVLALTGLAPGKEARYTFIEAFWISVLRTLGSTPIGGRDSAWGYRLMMLGVTLGSLFVFSTVISVVTNGMRTRLDRLKKGRSEVVESGHTVLLGWSEQVFTVIPELVTAFSSEPRSCIVILADRDKTEMEDELRQRIGHTGRTRLVSRTGDPMEMTDLHIASLNTARSIIVLSPESTSPDADVLKVVLAILNHPDRRREPYNIVAPIRNPKNIEVARVIGKDEVEWVRAGEMISRIIAQTSRQSGLSVVYNELLDYGGNEIYFHEEPILVGKTFGEVLLAADRDTVIGLFAAGGRPRLNPPPDTAIAKGDHLIVISTDNDQIAFNREPVKQVQKDLIRTEKPSARKPEKTLVLGWNWRGAQILHELDQYVAEGSEVLVMADRDGIRQALERDCQDLNRQSVCYHHGDTTDRQTLERLGLDQYDHIIILSYSDMFSPHQSDAQSLITLFHLRDIAERHSMKYTIVSEMLDVRNRNLAILNRADDFIVSDRIISLMIAQVAENNDLNAIFNDLFDPQGSELYLKPAAQYICLGQPVNFYTVVESARRRKEVAVGYRLASQANNGKATYGVVINPLKSAEVTFGPADQVIVLAKS